MQVTSTLELAERLRDIVDLIADAADRLRHLPARDIPAVRPILEVPGLVNVDAGGILRMSLADDHAVPPGRS